MLQVDHSSKYIGPTEDDATFDFVSLYAFLRRNLTTIGTCTALGLVFAAIFLINVSPRYTAVGQLIIDTRKIQLFQQQSVLADGIVDTAAVDSQVQLFQSKNVALSTIRKLKLTDDPEFVGNAANMLATVLYAVRNLISSDHIEETSSTEFLEHKAVDYLERNLKVRQLGRSYVIEYGFTSLSPGKAAQIANALAETYIVDQLEAKYQATRRASAWMQDRIYELREQAQEAARAVEEFKQQNKIITFTTGAGGGTRLINEQRLQEINSQLTLARAQTAEARAKLERVEEILQQGRDIGDAAVSDVLRNDVITRLRQQLLDASKREAEWSQRYGSGHLAAERLRQEMAQLHRVLQEELRRIGETYKSDYEIAKVREDAVQATLSDAIRDAATTNKAQIALRDLESTAQTYRTLYDTFLQRYTEALQQQSFPITDARVITSASAPITKSFPKPTLVIGIGIFVGIFGGLVAGFLREQFERVFRTTSEVERLLHVSCFGLLPLVKREKSANRSRGATTERPKGPSAANDSSVFRYVIDDPFSRFAETIRSVKVATDLAEITRPIKVLGVISAMPNEGKSTVATNLAMMSAHSGRKTLLIDADLRNPSLSRRLIGQNSTGLIEVLAGHAPLSAALHVDPVTGLHALPTFIQNRLPNSSDILSSVSMRKLLDEFRLSYDLVILDLPPLGPVVDARAIAHLVDGYLLVVEWGHTKIDVVTEALKSSEPIRERLFGAVLNKVNLEAVSRFDGYKTNYYFHKSYGRYLSDG